MRSTQRAVVVALAAAGFTPATLAAGNTAVPRPSSIIQEHRSSESGVRVEHVKRRKRHATTCPPMHCSVASWYYDAGMTASGWHARYGVANKTMAFGTRVRFCFPPGSHRCVIATVDDRGPFIPGRDFDLNQSTAAALGFGGVAMVSWTVSMRS